MMGLEAIRAESERAAREAARRHKKPLVLWSRDSLSSIPNLGSYVPTGWAPLLWADVPAQDPDAHGHYGITDVVLFVDKTGWGSEREPALTFPEGERQALAITREGEAAGLTVGWAIIEEGQFQVNIGAFKKVAAEKTECIFCGRHIDLTTESRAEWESSGLCPQCFEATADA